MNYLCGLCGETRGSYKALEQHRIFQHGPKAAIALRNEGRRKQ